MTAIERSRVVAVVGTGTMGQGIAQVALVAGHPCASTTPCPAAPRRRRRPSEPGWTG